MKRHILVVTFYVLELQLYFLIWTGIVSHFYNAKQWSTLILILPLSIKSGIFTIRM